MAVRARGNLERRPAPAPAPAPSHARVSFRHLPRIGWARRDRCFRRRPTRRAPRPGAPDPPLATNPQESERQLIAVTEFNENFKGKLIQVLWPDTGKWYNAQVIKVNMQNRTAKLFYVDSEEKEDINLYEAMLNMEVSWPFKGGVVGKTPASSEKKRKTRDESPPPSSSSDDDAPRDARPKKKTAAKKAAKKAAPAKRPPGAGAGPSDETRRVFAEKVKDAMLVASGELGSAGEHDSLDPASAADGVERAAHALFGKDVKKYNDKARSLLFNLKDPKNPSLRARVLTGELQPEALVRMTPADLARRDLQEMRREREARLGEDAFLTAGPVTRLVKTSKGEELVVVGGGEVVEEGDGLGNRKEETLAQQVAAAASAAAAAAAAAAAVPAAAPVEEGDTPRAPIAEAPPVPAPAELTTFEAFAAGVASSDEDEDAPAEDAGGDAQGDDDEYDPAKGFEAGGTAAAAADDDEPSPRREKEGAAKKTAPSDVAPPRASAGTWTGTLHLSGLGKSCWRAAAADGERASFHEVLPRALEIQGRVQFEETNVFLGEVFEGRSKTRGVTVGVGVPESADDAFARDLTAMYRKKERYGLVKGGKRGGDWELYLVPQGKLAARLLEVFKTSELDQASLAEEGASAMLWCVVHAKHLGPNARAKREQPSARSLNEARGFRESDEDDAGGTPPRTIPQAYQSTQLVDPYARANRAEPFHNYPQGAPPAPQYGAPPHVAFVTSVPPPPRRADRAEDFLNATFGAPPPAAVRTDVPPPPFARVADVPPPPFAAAAGGPPGGAPVFDPRRPDDREWGERRAREFRAGPSGFDRRDDWRDDWRDDRRDDRRDDWRDDRRDGPRFREDDRYRRDDRRRSPPRERRGEPPRKIYRDRGHTHVMHTHATEQHGRRSDRDAFSPRSGSSGRDSPRGGRGGRGGPFGGADDSPRGGRGRGGPTFADHGDRVGRGGLDSRLEAP